MTRADLPYRQAACGRSTRLTPAATSFSRLRVVDPALARNLHSGHNIGLIASLLLDRRVLVLGAGVTGCGNDILNGAEL